MERTCPMGVTFHTYVPTLQKSFFIHQSEDFAEDQHLVVEEYHSDDEDSTKKSKDAEEENEDQENEEHVTKV